MAAAPRKRAAPKAVPSEDDVEEQPTGPVRIGQRPAVMVDVFELDGVMYQAPAEPSAILVHDYLQLVRKAYQMKNAMARSVALTDASEFYVKGIIGEDAWEALRRSPLVTADDAARVVKLVDKKIGLPAVEKVTGALGNS